MLRTYSSTVHGGGDFDADGAGDYLAALAGGSGGVRVFSGANGALLREHRNTYADGLGSSMATIGDVDGDGGDDYALGAPGDRTGGVDAGAVYLISGRLHHALGRYYGSAPGDRLGPVAAIGDIDGDGVPDLLVAAPGADRGGSDSGEVRAISGRTGSVIRTHSGNPGERAGEHCVGLGDTDGDGVGDYAFSRVAFGGSLSIVSGRTGSLRQLLAVSANPITQMTAVGDTDGDRVADLVVGDAAARASRLISGRTLTERYRLGADGGPGSVAGVGDIDGDGAADLASLEGTSVQIISGQSGRRLRPAVFSPTTTFIAASGDMDGNGAGEVVVNSGADLIVVSAVVLTTIAEPHEIDLATGGAQDLYSTIGPSPSPSRFYLMLASASGTRPGLGLGPVVWPLNPDALFLALLGNPNQPPYFNNFGFVTGSGSIQRTRFTVPAGLPPALAGLTIHHSVLIGTFQQLEAASRPRPLTLRLGGPGGNRVVEDLVARSTQLDPDRSTGDRLGQPRIALGGRGLHGDFDYRLGAHLGGNVWLWDLTRDTRGGVRGFAIPAANTLSNREELVTDGVFEFATMHVPAGVTVQLTGPHPARFLVRGRAQIDGTLACDGAAVPIFLGHNTGPTPGQAGGLPGCGGGRGGDGADAVSGAANALPGQHGSDVQVAAGHAYRGQAAGTGGRGASAFPPTRTQVRFNYLNVICAQLPAGAGGGGFRGAGQTGVAVTGPVMADLGPPNPGGGAFPLFPLPGNRNGLEHFSVGGAGGGGGSSHGYNRSAPLFVWRPGAAGAGGGGVVAVRAGNALRGAATAMLTARGGSGAVYTHLLQGPPGLGGGGSGGSVLLQSGSLIDVAGQVAVSGGSGARLLPDPSAPLTNVEANGGDGADGFIRLEAPFVRLGSAAPPLTTANVQIGILDRDAFSGDQTRWYATGNVLPARFVRYELVLASGATRIYSDDPAIGPRAQFGDPSVPVWLKVQGAVVDRSGGEPLPGSIGLWRDTVGDFGGSMGLNADDANGFRIVLIYNHAGFPSPPAVERIRVVFTD